MTAVLDHARLIDRLQRLGAIGRGPSGGPTRLALTDADRAGRDLLAGWMREAGLEVRVDRIGNIFGLWPAAGERRPGDDRVAYRHGDRRRHL